MIERCNGCGEAVEGGSDGCHARYEALLARDYSDTRFFGSHRLLVDTYSLQHPERYCRSAKSLAAHLVGLCMIFERGASTATGDPALRAWLDGAKDLHKPALPEARGDITLGDVLQLNDPQSWQEAVREWGLSVWGAYGPLQHLARRWADMTAGAARSGRERGSR